MRPHRQQPTRLPCPWDSPGKNTGVGCHFLLQCMKVKRESEVAQSCPTLCDPMDCSLPGSSVWVVTITLKIFSSAVSNLKIELFYLISLVIQVVLCPLVAIRIGRWEAYFNQNERADLIETGDRSWPDMDCQHLNLRICSLPILFWSSHPLLSVICWVHRGRGQGSWVTSLLLSQPFH